MHTIYVADAASKLGVPIPRVFALAMEWNEEFHSKDYLVNQYNKYYWDGIVPDFVSDFVIDVLAGRVTR